MKLCFGRINCVINSHQKLSWHSDVRESSLKQRFARHVRTVMSPHPRSFVPSCWVQLIAAHTCHQHLPVHVTVTRFIARWFFASCQFSYSKFCNCVFNTPADSGWQWKCTSWSIFISFPANLCYILQTRDLAPKAKVIRCRRRRALCERGWHSSHWVGGISLGGGWLWSLLGWWRAGGGIYGGSQPKISSSLNHGLLKYYFAPFSKAAK